MRPCDIGIRALQRGNRLYKRQVCGNMSSTGAFCSEIQSSPPARITSAPLLGNHHDFSNTFAVNRTKSMFTIFLYFGAILSSYMAIVLESEC